MSLLITLGGGLLFSAAWNAWQETALCRFSHQFQWRRS